MKEGKPQLPVGSSAKWFFMRQVWFYLWGGRFPLKGKNGVKVEHVDGTYVVSINTPRQQQVEARFHPFKVMESPPNPADPETGWRTFRVRAGAYGTTPVAGTDGADVAAGGTINDVDDPATETLDEAYSTSIDFIVPDATAEYYIWVDATDPALPEIGHGATIPGGGTDDDWWGGSYFLLCIIDTDTFTTDKIAKKRQFVRDDIPKCL